MEQTLKRLIKQETSSNFKFLITFLNTPTEDFYKNQTFPDFYK